MKKEQVIDFTIAGLIPVLIVGWCAMNFVWWKSPEGFTVDLEIGWLKPKYLLTSSEKAEEKREGEEVFVYDLPVVIGEVEGVFRNHSASGWGAEMLAAPEAKVDFTQFRKLAEGRQVYVSTRRVGGTEVHKIFHVVMSGGEVVVAEYVANHYGWLVMETQGVNKAVFYH